MPDAADRLIADLRRVLGCVTASRLLVRPTGRNAGSEWLVGLAGPGAVRASGPLRGSTLSVHMSIEAVGDIARVSAYALSFSDRSGIELLAWHWHPGTDFPGPDYPHLHVSAALRPSLAAGERAVLPLDKLHLPTGHVTLAAVVRMLVEEFGVQPVAADWRERLAGEAT